MTQDQKAQINPMILAMIAIQLRESSGDKGPAKDHLKQALDLAAQIRTRGRSSPFHVGRGAKDLTE